MSYFYRRSGLLFYLLSFYFAVGCGDDDQGPLTQERLDSLTVEQLLLRTYNFHDYKLLNWGAQGARCSEVDAELPDCDVGQWETHVYDIKRESGTLIFTQDIIQHKPMVTPDGQVFEETCKFVIGLTARELEGYSPTERMVFEGKGLEDSCNIGLAGNDIWFVYHITSKELQGDGSVDWKGYSLSSGLVHFFTALEEEEVMQLSYDDLGGLFGSPTGFASIVESCSEPQVVSNSFAIFPPSPNVTNYCEPSCEWPVNQENGRPGIVNPFTVGCDIGL